MGRKNLIQECLDCYCFLDDENWPKSAKKDGWRICIDCLRKRSNQAAKKYNERKRTEDENFDRKRHLRHSYNLSLEDYDKLFEQQNGLCAICSKINTMGRRLVVDHNHETGEIRKLLCHRCNMGLGIYENEKEKFEKYLRMFI